MKAKVFEQLSTIIEIKIVEIESYFTSYLVATEKEIKEMKSQSYGGYEIQKIVDEFSEIINLKSSELIETIIHLAINCGRNFSSKQYLKLNETCASSFQAIINRFSKLLTNEFENTETLNIALKTTNDNVLYKIEKNILAIKIYLNKKIDIALRWTAIGVLVSAIGIIISTVVSILTIFLE